LKLVAKIAGLVILFCLVAAAGIIAYTFMGRKPLPDGVDLNGIHLVKDGIVSVAVIPLEDGKVALIDSGNDGEGKAVLAELSARRLSPDAVAAIFLTHGHPDHTAGVKLFPKAEVMAMEREVALAEGREAGKGPLNRLMGANPNGTRITHPLHDGETVRLGETVVRAYAIPGHTAGSAAYLVNGVLFLGDAADASGDGKIVGSAWLFSESQSQDRESLAELEQQLKKDSAEVKVIAFAHSGPLYEGLAPLSAFVQSK
jgi:glyoxylase-like metal-dependent hydrolase (beta-lactamase superfamily II)